MDLTIYNPNMTISKMYKKPYFGDFDIELAQKVKSLADWTDLIHSETVLSYNSNKDIAIINSNVGKNAIGSDLFGRNLVYKYDSHGNWIEMKIVNAKSGQLEGIKDRCYPLSELI